jgi:hypothetical protein
MSPVVVGCVIVRFAIAVVVIVGLGRVVIRVLMRVVVRGGGRGAGRGARIPIHVGKRRPGFAGEGSSGLVQIVGVGGVADAAVKIEFSFNEEEIRRADAHLAQDAGEGIRIAALDRAGHGRESGGLRAEPCGDTLERGDGNDPEQEQTPKGDKVNVRA